MKMNISLITSAFLVFLATRIRSSNNATVSPSPVSPGNSLSQAQIEEANIRAFLKTIQYAEGTFYQSNPYAVTYAYDHIITNFSDHPTNTGEWLGKTLPDSFCTNVGLSPGCKSTASGAYQFIVGTWNEIKSAIGNLTFNSWDQDRAAEFRIQQRGAYSFVANGLFEEAIFALNREWASLTGSPYGQPTKSMDQLKIFYKQQGGFFNYETFA